VGMENLTRLAGSFAALKTINFKSMSNFNYETVLDYLCPK